MDDYSRIISEFSDSNDRRAIWHRTITSVGLVTSIKDNMLNVMACEWAIQISFNPPTYLIVVGKTHATAEFILESKEFGITFAADDQATLSHVSGSNSRYDLDKIETGIFPYQEGKTIKSPIIKGGVLAVECKLIKTVELPGRYLFIGEATHSELREDKNPLLYHAGKYYKVGENIPKPEYIVKP